MLLESKRNLSKAIQARAARAAASPSATRNQGKNVAGIARDYLRTLRLRRFGGTGITRTRFLAELDRATEELRGLLPGRSWGLARKLLNIFLRDAHYTSYLSHRFGLNRLEAHLELPLDKYTVTELKKRVLLAPARDCTNFTAERWTTGWIFFPRQVSLVGFSSLPPRRLQRFHG